MPERPPDLFAAPTNGTLRFLAHPGRIALVLGLACSGLVGASLSYLLDNMAVTDVLAHLLRANGDCSDTTFKVLGLTLAQASLLIFMSFALSLVMLLRRQPAAPA